jgi:hypothetical protein
LPPHGDIAAGAVLNASATMPSFATDSMSTPSAPQ